MTFQGTVKDIKGVPCGQMGSYAGQNGKLSLFTMLCVAYIG